MEDAASRRFFTDPNHACHRRYEALRAVFVDGRSQKEVADAFGFTYGSMRQLVFDFRRNLEDETTATEDFFSRPQTANRGELQ
jgi:DNA-directed RNA polymerase specialized sigma24 family protein